MVIALTGLVVLPLVAAMSILFFVVRDDVGEHGGRQLAQEARQLAESLQSELQRSQLGGAALEDLQQSLDLLQPGATGVAVLYTNDGRRLAGNLQIPLPPGGSGGGGWISFDVAGESYFAGVAAVAPEAGAASGWHLAVVQPASEVYAHFLSLSSKVAFLVALFGIMFVMVAWGMADRFLRPILKIRRGAEIISRINLRHRIELDTGDVLEELAVEINHMAENLARDYDALEGRVREATHSLQEERNRLATVLRTMVDGVVVANRAAEISLMNPRARFILGPGFTTGIGSELSRIFPPDRLGFYLRRLRRVWNPDRGAVEEVIFPLPEGKLLKGFLSVVPGGTAGEEGGFLLVFRDLSTPAEEGDQFEATMREMPQLLRGPVATSRSLVEALQKHGEMPAEKQQAFLAGLAEELNRLGERVAAMEEAAGAVWMSHWPAVPSDPRELLEESLDAMAGLRLKVELEEPDGPIPPVLVEPFSWVASLQCVLHWIAQQGGAGAVCASLREEDGTLVTSFRVKGSFPGNLADLENLEVAPAGEGSLPLGEMVRRNRGELWARSSTEFFEVRLALLQAAGAAEVRREDGLIEGEPEFYNFDLFLPRPVVEREDQLQAELADLDYVVFDTETTGLQLSQGDKVISISGVRIRRGRFQEADLFHTLVNPGRPIPPESIRIHHIEDHMVATAPSMSEVYPRFAEYVGDAVLVAHNAAFDKKCLDLAAAEAGLPQLDNPYLDTLLLSYGLHAGTEGHSLDAIAERMGITIEGRHTSLGDARATAQAFLGLLALLPARGVRTLADAKAFCDRQLLLRWQSSRF